MGATENTMNWIEGIYQKGDELDRNGSKEKTNGKGGVMICHNKSDTVHPKSSSKLPFRLPWWFTKAPNRPPRSTPPPKKGGNESFCHEAFLPPFPCWGPAPLGLWLHGTGWTGCQKNPLSWSGIVRRQVVCRKL